MEGSQLGTDAAGAFADDQGRGGDALHAAHGLNRGRGDGALELGGQLGDEGSGEAGVGDRLDGLRRGGEGAVGGESRRDNHDCECVVGSP